MVMWGKQARRPSLGFENDGYFDTATFGDIGGQLWVLRFNRPGVDGRGREGPELVRRPDLHARLLVVAEPLHRVPRPPVLLHHREHRAPRLARVPRVRGNGRPLQPARHERGHLRSRQHPGVRAAAAAPSRSPSRTTPSPRRARVQRAGARPAGLLELASRATQDHDRRSAGVRREGALARSRSRRVPTPPARPGSARTWRSAAGWTRTATTGAGTTKATSSTAAPAYGSPLTLDTNLSSHPLSRNWYFSLKVFDDTGPHAIFDDAVQRATCTTPTA